jgi:predicted DNA-binding protein (UPF0251 family)
MAKRSLISIDDAAARAGVSRQVLARALQRGQLRGLRIEGKTMIEQQSLEKFRRKK